ncbi:MAG: response regulator transcription factor [Clostridium sp.]|nr:response regulator transcription factor [Clostridium sp.]
MYEKILVLQAEPKMRRYMGSFLQNGKYHCTLTDKGRTGLSAFRKKWYDLIVLDMMLKEGDSLEILKEIRSMSDVPVIATSRKGEDDKANLVSALDLGADDYIMEPFGEGEFLARVRRRLRRSMIPEHYDMQENTFHIEYLTVDFNKVRVTVHEKAVHFTSTEYRLLSLLINNRGKVLTYENISWELWGRNFDVNRKIIRVHINMIRHKIMDHSEHPRFIFTIPGYGYMFSAHL